MSKDPHAPVAQIPEALLPAIQERWSPRAFGDGSVSPEDLRLIFHAARWAASGNNGQPWRFLVARREETEAFATLLDCLVPPNQRWANRAAALVVGLARTVRVHPDGATSPYLLGYYELGLAMGQLGIQATALGLRVHQMAGFVADKVRERCGVPAEFTPIVMAAIGHPGDPDSLPEDLATRERAPRVRVPLHEIAFGARFGEAAGWADEG